MQFVPAERFHRTVAILALAYCLIETIYVLRLPLVMDEFDGAYEAYRLQHQLPYRDYIPYKTVLGYYFEGIPALIRTSVWSRIRAIKLTLVLINSVMLAAAAICVARFLDRTAVVGALVLLIACSNFLERSGELRVDMLTAWAGLGSLLFLLAGRTGWSGALCGISFLLSQKGALYFIAGNAAVFVCWFLYHRLDRGLFAALRPLALFNAVFAFMVALYVLLWAIFAPVATVIRSTFFAAAGQALLSAYAIRWHYWTQILLRNPLPFVLAALAVIVLLRAGRRQTVIAVYGGVLLMEGITYKQPWPYFFPMLLPTMFVLHAALFDRVKFPRWVVIVVAIGGVLYPLARLPVVIARSNAYQRYNVQLAGALLAPHDTYLAGTDIVHDHEQTLQPLERLDGLMLERLRAEPPRELDAMVGALAAHPPKLVIANYRVYYMPAALKAWIDANFARLSGSLLAYAPRYSAGVSQETLDFAGRYQIDTRTPSLVQIDGRFLHTGGFVSLERGVHLVASTQQVRLRLLPENVAALLDPAFVDEQPFYPNVYDY